MKDTNSPDQATTALKGVCLKKGGNRVFSEFDLQIWERRVGIIGRNGSGKSLLLRMIAGLIIPDAGEVRVNGVDVGNDRRKAISTVGILFQNPDHQIIFPTVEEEIAFGLTQQGASKAEGWRMARDVLTRFGREAWAERSIQTLSQGQRHLVCLLAVVAMQPALILLDEPFAGLDAPTTIKLTRHLSSLDQSVIHVSHNLQILEAYERIIWIDGGQIRGDGAPGPVIASYREEMQEIGETDDFADL
ncbi:MAG: ABC transporter ATP-binding protein [Pseudomonadota bacterium]